VVVTDLEMPTMDGYQLVRLLKSDASTAAIPVLVLTNHDEAPSRFWGLRAGADAYLTMDYLPGELLAAVESLLAGSPSLPAPAGPPPSGPLEVLARVARQLDATLMRATLANAVLERGMAAANLHDACRTVLDNVSEVADARLLGVALAEVDAVTLHLLLPQPTGHASVDDFGQRLLAFLQVPVGAPLDVQVTGTRTLGNDTFAWRELVLLSLPLRDAQGVLGLVPRDSSQYASVSRPLLDALRGHLALVLDNARLAQRLAELSMLDGLTRLFNHRAIYQRLAEELARSRRYGHELAVVICDLDHFKQVNDTHGHLAGDAVLRSATAAMRPCLRGPDIIGRYGGEEFLVVLPESDLEAGRQAAERLRRALSSAVIPVASGSEVRITGSFGVAAASELDTSASAQGLVSLADARLYEAKSAGRDCIRP
jgi:two-component system cell cycle response regulator